MYFSLFNSLKLSSSFDWDHRQSKEWTGNAGKIANVADATSVIWPDTLYFGTRISNLNIFQDFVFTNFKQEQECLCNYPLLKLLLGITKLITECLRYF